MSGLSNRIGTLGIGIAAIVLSVAVTLFWYLGYAQKIFEPPARIMKVEFPAVQQLQEGDPVRLDGREEGRVQEIADLGGGRGALVTFDVSEEAGPVYGDAEVELRWKNLLGGAFYLEVDRGTPRGGELGNRTIPRDQASSQVEVDDVVSVFEGDAREGLISIPKELNKGLADPDGLERLLGAAEDASPGLERSLLALRGNTLDSTLRRFVTGTAATVAALDAPEDGLRRLVAGAGATLETTAARSADLSQTLEAGPQLTEDVRVTLARLDTTLAGTDQLVDKLDRSAGDLEPTLKQLRPTLASTAALLDRAQPLVRDLRPTARSLAGLGRSGPPLIDDLQPSLDRIDEEILPFLSRKDPGTGKPTSVMIGGTAAGFGGSASQQDENGHFIRFPVTVGSSTANISCETTLTDPSAAELLVCDSLQEAFEEYLEYVPDPSFLGGTP